MLHQALEAVMASAATGLAAAGIHILLLLAARFKYQVSAAQAAQLQQTAKNAILWAEEWAAQKYSLEGVTKTGAEKLEKAVEQIVEKLPNVSADDAADIVHSSLPQMGLGALVGLSKTLQAVQPKPPTNLALKTPPASPGN